MEVVECYHTVPAHGVSTFTTHLCWCSSLMITSECPVCRTRAWGGEWCCPTLIFWPLPDALLSYHISPRGWTVNFSSLKLIHIMSGIMSLEISEAPQLLSWWEGCFEWKKVCMWGEDVWMRTVPLYTSSTPFPPPRARGPGFSVTSPSEARASPVSCLPFQLQLGC